MYGRNGVDALTVVLVIASAVLGLLRRIPVVGLFIWTLQMIVLVFAIYRIFSKNLEARRRENSIISGLQKSFYSWKIRQENSKVHKFFKCPSCRNMLRVPRGKGKIFITCPKCGERFQKRT
jgi:LSD1 subclass zinc finger protein